MYWTQNSYAPSADTLYVDIKDIIEQRFPRLEQDIIDDAVDYGTNEYRAYLLTGASEIASDREAEVFFLNSVMERIRERGISERDAIIAFMLAKYRHNTAPLTVNKDLNQAFSSDLLTLQLLPGQLQKMFEPILEENRNKFTPQTIFFPEVKRPIRHVPLFLYEHRKNQFWSLSYKLKRQIESISYSSLWRDDLKIKMFDEIYRLAQLNLNANILETLILHSVIGILFDSSLSDDERIDFIESFQDTMNKQENKRYCQIYLRNLRMNSRD